MGIVPSVWISSAELPGAGFGKLKTTVSDMYTLVQHKPAVRVLHFGLSKDLCGNYVPSLNLIVGQIDVLVLAKVLEPCVAGVMEDRRSTKIPRPPGALRSLTSNVCFLHG